MHLLFFVSDTLTRLVIVKVLRLNMCNLNIKYMHLRSHVSWKCRVQKHRRESAAWGNALEIPLFSSHSTCKTKVTGNKRGFHNRRLTNIAQDPSLGESPTEALEPFIILYQFATGVNFLELNTNMVQKLNESHCHIAWMVKCTIKQIA